MQTVRREVTQEILPPRTRRPLRTKRTGRRGGFGGKAPASLDSYSQSRTTLLKFTHARSPLLVVAGLSWKKYHQPLAAPSMRMRLVGASRVLPSDSWLQVWYFGHPDVYATF